MKEEMKGEEITGAASELSAMLFELRAQGCFPCVAYRGSGVWRAHVNATGNYWGEAKRPEDAMASAIRLWERAGKPIDGYAHNG